MAERTRDELGEWPHGLSVQVPLLCPHAARPQWRGPESLRKGDLITIHLLGSGSTTVRVMSEPTKSDEPWSGTVTFDIEQVIDESMPDGAVEFRYGGQTVGWLVNAAADSEPVPADHYPDPIPREDQDYDGARRPHGPRPDVPAQAVRPATETGDDAGQ